MIRRVSLLLAGLFMAAAAHAQNPSAVRDEAGRPFFTCFTTREHGGAFQTWAFAQDTRGVLYAGNNLGVLEYDGASWRLIATSSSVVRALAPDADGRIYVGAFADFGYLAPDAAGRLQFVSLREYVPEEDRAFNDIWTVYVTGDGIYFQARERLFRFTPNGEGWDVKVWQPQERFMYAFWIDGTYYVHQGGIGLTKMVGDTLVPVPGGDLFANDRLQVMLPFDEANGSQRLLLGSFSLGLFLYDGQRFTPFPTVADALWRVTTLYKGVALADGTFGLVTTDAGFVVIDHQGKLRMHLDQSTGLTSSTMYAAFADRDGQAWVAPNNGICQVETVSPLSRYDEGDGLIGALSDMLRHKGMLYVATESGIYYLEPGSGRFRLVEGLKGNTQSFKLLEVGDELIAGLNGGLFRIQGTKATPIKLNVAGGFEVLTLHRSRRNPDRVFAGLGDGLATLRRDASGRWIDEGRLEGFYEYLTDIVEPEPGLLWLGTADQGVLRVRLDDGSPAPRTIERFGRAQGLPSDGGVAVHDLDYGLVFAMQEGIFRFDEAAGRFMPDTLLTNAVGFGGTQDEYSLVEDKTGNLWINFGKETAVLRRQADGTYRVDKTALLRFADVPAYAIYPEADGVVWFGSAEGLIRYDPGIKKDYQADFPVLIRRVTVDEDSVIYGGAYAVQKTTPSLAYAHNALRFTFAALSYENPRENQYQSMLEGFDDHWSVWTKENRRDYTNLPPGNYTFRVRAKNTYNAESAAASYTLKILPPWYRTWGAYAFYAVLFALGLFVADRVQRRRLIRKERARAQLREAELRAEAAEALAASESERKKNIELLSRIGRTITATLSVVQVIDTVYENVNALMDAAVFGIGLYNEAEQRIDFPATKENGQTLPPFFNRLDDADRLAVWCFKNKQEVISNDYGTEYRRYVSRLQNPVAGEHTQSILYLPLMHQDKAIGVITAQSFEKNAYTEHHVNILRNLAIYTAIALDNADAYRRLGETLEDLRAMQEQLVVQEKLASLGALTAGIAHEIKNPLNFVNNFAQLCGELAVELDEELATNREKPVAEVEDELKELLAGLKINAAKIEEHGRRADSIVKSMLQHSRGAAGERRATDVNALLDEYVNLAYHGMRAQVADFNVTINRNYDEAVGMVDMVPQEIGQVLINLLNNAFYAVQDKRRASDGSYVPVVSVTSRRLGHAVEIRVHDNGSGIPTDVKEKIFEPFFTTKPTGTGTGLGLSLSYDIVTQGHGGRLAVESTEGEGATFVVTLPA